jgi:Bacterial archaeo-eukaryotic release factor family 3
MNPINTNEIREVMEAVHYRPAISIILPFEPKMSLKTEVAHALKIASDKAEAEVMSNYPGELGRLVIQKLNNIIRNLNYNTHKKSIAIYVSPVFEKVLYLDVPVEEKIIVDESFEIRDLVYSKKQLHKYLVLVLSGNESKIFLGNTTEFVRIASTTPDNVIAGIHDTPQRVANFSDMSEHKEIMMEKFLRHIDQSLDILLNAYPLPLFVMGAERISGHFKNITQHNAAVIDYVYGNYEETTIPQLKEKLAPYIADWKSVMEKDLLNHLEEAAGKKKLAIGIKEVWKEAMHNKGRLLVVEKNYMYAAQHGATEDIIYELADLHSSFSYIKDAVDDIIEKVLQSGGDVEFVDDGVLKEYNKIALIQYF